MDRLVEKRTGIKVLHVDDEHYFLELTKGYLESENEDFTVNSATSGEEGVELVKRGDYDVVIADYQMPGMGGLEFLQHLRESGNTIPFIMLTGRGREEVAIEALNRGADHYLQKGGDRASMYGTLTHAIRDAVEKKRAVEALRESERAYRTIFETTGTATVIIEEDTTLSLVNTQFEELSGYSRENVEGKKSWTEFIVDEDLERMKEYHRFRRIDPTAAPTGYEFRLIDKADNRKAILLSVSMIPGTKKSVASLLDITERKRAEEALRESEKRLMILLDSIPSGIVLIDAETHEISSVNSAAVKMIGVPQEQIIGSVCHEFICPAEKGRCPVTDLGQSVDSSERVLLKADGERMPILKTVVPIMLDGRQYLLESFIDITDRKKAEEELRESEEKYRNLVERANDGICIIQDGIVKYLNPRLAELWGGTVEEVTGTSFTEYVHPDEHHKVLGYYKRRMAGEAVPEIYETALRRKDGSKVYAELNASTISYQGNVADFVFVRDITERKRAEEALKESESKFRSIIESSKDGIIFFDGKTRKIIFGNGAMAELLGCSKEDLVGRSIPSLHPSEEWASVEQEFLKHVRGEVSISMGIPVVRNDGSVFYADISSSPITLEGRSYFSAFFRDISERKAMEETLRKSEDEYRSLVESTEDSIYLVDRDCRYLFMNEKHLARLGMPRDQIIGKTYGELHSEEESGRFAEIVGRVFETNKSAQHEHRSRRDNRYFLRTLSPVKDPEGRTTAVTVISKDLTERKKLDEEREHLLKELEAKNRELERFAYTVSHDLRSPLITIQGFTDMLRKDFEENEREKVENDLQHITKATTQMSRLLHDTLQLSRIGRMANPPEDVSFGKIVDDALGQTAGELTAKNVRVAVAKEFPTVHVDRMRMVEALVNLITNCIKYMGDQPSPEIDIGYRVEGAEMVFFVKDNGMGIDPSQHEKVFELFYKVDSRSEGTGAGLAIVKRIIEVHGGRIWMESEIGKGCTVCFTLPVVSG